MNYRQLKNKIQKEFNDFPMFFAFSEKQFNEGRSKLGITSNKDLLSINHGGFIKKSDRDKFTELNESISKQKEDFLNDKQNLIDALVYELGNHEFCITYDEEPTLDALGLDINNLTPMQTEALKESRKIYLETVEV